MKENQKVYVSFENANDLTMDEIKSMAADGYEFEMSNGKITGVYVPQ